MSSGERVWAVKAICSLFDVGSPRDLSCAFSHSQPIASLEEQRKPFPDKDTMAQIGHFPTVTHLGIGRGRANPDASSPEVASHLLEFLCQAITVFIRGRSRDQNWDKAIAAL